MLTRRMTMHTSPSLRLLAIISIVVGSNFAIAADGQKPLYFQKLYDGGYRPRWDVSYLQVQDTRGDDVFRPASLRIVDGKPITDDSVPYEIAPGKHQLDYSCRGKGKKPELGSTSI